MALRRDYNILVKKDGKFYVGYCLEIPQARVQGNTKTEAVSDTKEAIKLFESNVAGEYSSRTLPQDIIHEGGA